MSTPQIELLENELVHAYDPVQKLNEITYERAKIWFSNEIVKIDEDWIKPIIKIYGRSNWAIQIRKDENEVLIGTKLYEIFEEKFRLDKEKAFSVVRDHILKNELMYQITF